MKTSPAAPVAKPTEPAPAISKGLRRFLFLTAGIAGAAVMIIEILGAKMLSPYVGLSHFVWTAQIAVTLIALACGYYVGGRLADRSQKLSWLYFAIIAAAGYMALSVLICAPVAYWCLDFNLAVGSLLASAILFFIPLALLAMTGPFLARIVTASVSGVGTSVGRLTAVSTIGSFIGTLLIGYFMVPYLPNSATMFLTALLLLLVCGIYFSLFRQPAIGTLALILVVALGAGGSLRAALSSKPARVVELFRGNSHFGELRVFDFADGTKRYYLNDYLVQNTYDPFSKKSTSEFTYMLADLTRAYTKNIHDVLCIGLGVGIVPMDFARSGCEVDVAEINAAVVPVAARFFDLDTNKLHITIDDGRHFLNRSRKKYDAVVLDAFLGDSSPSHLMTREAFASIEKALKPGGVLVINAFANLDAGRDFFAASLHKTLGTAFQSVRIHGGQGQLFFVASNRPALDIVRQPDFNDVSPDTVDGVKDAFATMVDTDPAHGIVLRDNYNPAEFYDARNREELRKNLATSFRNL